MEENCSQFLENLEHLKKAYKVSNNELALAIGLSSPSAFSNYKARNSVPKDVRDKIARYFHISEEELMKLDFSDIHIDMDLLHHTEKLSNKALNMYPIISTEEALQNEAFKEAYDAQMRVVDAMRNQKYANDEDYDIFLKQYVKAYEEGELPEALANIIWWNMIIETVIKRKNLFDGVKAFQEKKIKSKDFFKNYYLEEGADESVLEPMSEEDVKSWMEIDEGIMDMLKELKEIPEYAPLADYYVALRYVMDCVPNGLSSSLNGSIGSEMMNILIEFENEYAINFLKS